jgi:hypothetical protein
LPNHEGLFSLLAKNTQMVMQSKPIHEQDVEESGIIHVLPYQKDGHVER